MSEGMRAFTTSPADDQHHEPQSLENSCGPAAMTAALRTLGVIVSQDDLIQRVGLHDHPDGITTPDAMYAVLVDICTTKNLSVQQQQYITMPDRERGIREIEQSLARRDVVIICYVDHGEGHYAVIKSISRESKTITLNDPYYGGNHTIGLDAFLHQWDDAVHTHTKGLTITIARE